MHSSNEIQHNTQPSLSNEIQHNTQHLSGKREKSVSGGGSWNNWQIELNKKDYNNIPTLIPLVGYGEGTIKGEARIITLTFVHINKFLNINTLFELTLLKLAEKIPMFLAPPLEAYPYLP